LHWWLITPPAWFSVQMQSPEKRKDLQTFPSPHFSSMEEVVPKRE
jgi:hypothetical protein